MSTRIKFGWGATSIWLIFWLMLLFFEWEKAMPMTFNEWGDFLAGISAPLAFMWLIIGYFQQGEELSLNTKALEQQEEALKLQVDELKQSVEQQNRSAVAQSKQTEIAGLMARLDAVNHIIDSIERQAQRAKESGKADSTKIQRILEEKQKQHEVSMEKLLYDIEKLEGKPDE